MSNPKNLFLILFLFVLTCFCFTPVKAQTATATLGGTVTDEKDAVVPGASITLVNVGTGARRNTTTNENGYFILPLLPPSQYTLTVEQKGFATIEVPDVVLNVGDQKALQIQLKIGTITGEVVVTPEASLVDTSPAVSTTIDRQFAGNLPLNGRSFQSLILLTPGVVPNTSGSGGFSVNGQRGNANQFTVDGVSANVGVDVRGVSPSEALAGTTPATTALGTTQNLVTIDALEEFKIQTSSYSAEFGRQPGGQVQLVTRSGNNTFHGSGFDYVRNEAFEANDWFINSKPLTASQIAAGLTKQPRTPLRQHLFGGSFSGPVFFPNFGDGGPGWYNGKNRTFFFLSYEGLRLKLPQSSSWPVPSLQLRQSASAAIKPLLNAYSLPTDQNEEADGVARFITSTSSPLRHDTLSLRIDHSVSQKLSIFGRYSKTPSESLSRFPGYLTGARAESRVLTLGVTFAPTSTISNEFRFNYTRNRGRSGTTLDTFGGAVPFELSQLVTGYTGSDRVQGSFQFQLPPGGTPSIALGDSIDSYNQQLQIVDNFAWIKGSHSLKFGIDYRRLTPRFGPVPYSQTVIFQSAQQIRNGIARAVFVRSQQEAHPIFDNFSAYAEDTWKATKRLTLDLGVRWEFNPPPGEANGLRPLLVIGVENLPTARLAPAGSRLYKTDYKAFAPRLGAVYQLIRKPGKELVVRGQFGVYYDQGNGLAAAGFNSFPFLASSPTLLNVPLPLTASQAAPPSFSLTGMASSNILALNPDLALPYTLEWNLAVERSLGANQTLSVSWVGNAGRKLLWDHWTNQNVPGVGKPNPNFGSIDFVSNGPTSDYNAMQVQFQRRLSHGLQALVNYTWGHAIDEVSNEGQGGVLERGNASVDIRHNFSTAFTYELRTKHFGPILKPIINGWSINALILAQTGLPLDLRSGFSNQILPDGSLYFTRPDVVPGQPFWVHDPDAPAGVHLNPAAFNLVPTPITREGTLGRNAVHAPGIRQVNMAIGRKFRLTEKLNLQLTAEAFNVFNTPLFWGWGTTITADRFTNKNFGRPQFMFNRGIANDLTRQYEIGGPRSMQFAARLSF